LTNPNDPPAMKSDSPLHRAKRQRTSASILVGAFTLAFSAVSMPLGQTHAQDVYEGFDYPDGTNLNPTNGTFAGGENGGTGWGSNWGGGAGEETTRVTVAGSLEYPGITSTGNKLEIE